MVQTINDYSRYITLMRNGFYDKLFFVDKLFDEWSTFLDYGCADGFMSKMIAEIFPDKHIIGYDEDVTMSVKQLFSGVMPSNITFEHDSYSLEEADIIYLSSLLHEVYSYKTKEQIDAFWKMVFSKSRKYVIIRDMVHTPTDIWHSSVDRKNRIESVERYVQSLNQLGELRRFEAIYGSLYYPNSFIHFLLKYMYIGHGNWERELNENYLSVTSQELSRRTPAGWEVVHSYGYSLPYLKHRWKKDFGFHLNPLTHKQLILKRI